MILISANLDKVDFIPQRYAQTDIFQSFSVLVSEHIPTIFDWGDEVIQKQGLVVALFDMVGHSFILPRSKLTGKSY